VQNFREIFTIFGEARRTVFERTSARRERAAVADQYQTLDSFAVMAGTLMNDLMFHNNLRRTAS
jgi:hypothetical protein